MKSKKNIYILIPAVLLIWGIIGFRMFSGLGPSVKPIQNTTLAQQFKPNDKIVRDKFVIDPNYRDPFLGTLSIKKSSKKSNRVIPKIKETVVFPPIEYKGIFSSANNSNPIYLILINGNQEMFKKNETHQNVKLLKGDKEKITVKFKNEKKIYYLK